MKLSFKLWIYIIISSIVSLVLFVSSAVIIGKMNNHGYTHKTLKVLANNIISDVKNSPLTESSLHQIMGSYQTKHPSLGFEWLSADGNILYSSEGRTKPYTFSEYSNLFVNQPYSLWTAGEDVNLIYPAEIAAKSYYLHLHIPTDAMQSTQFQIYVQHNSDLMNLLIPFIIFLVTPYLFIFFFFYRLRKRLNRLNKGLSETTLENQKQIEDQSKDEIGQLTRHFNAMSQRIRDQVEQIQEQETKRKTLISNLSHDLRTPLTNILGYAETIYKKWYKNEEELQTHAEIIFHRSQYMEKLINTLFDVSQFDLHGIKIRKESYYLTKVLRKTLAEYLPVLKLKQFTTNFSIPDLSAALMIDPYLMERALRNLLDNAMEYGASGKYLGVEYKEEDKQVKISIIDRGKGIPKDQLPFLFDRFYQGSQNRKSEGFGLGLSIVKEIALAHDGDITVTSIPNQETLFTLILPRGSENEETA